MVTLQGALGAEDLGQKKNDGFQPEQNG